MRQEALRSTVSVDASQRISLFTRQCHILIAGDPTLGCPAIAKALYKAEDKPLAIDDLSNAANDMLRAFGREPLSKEQLAEDIVKLGELYLVYETPEGLLLTPTGQEMAEVLSKPVPQSS